MHNYSSLFYHTWKFALVHVVLSLPGMLSPSHSLKSDQTWPSLTIHPRTPKWNKSSLTQCVLMISLSLSLSLSVCLSLSPTHLPASHTVAIVSLSIYSLSEMWGSWGQFQVVFTFYARTDLGPASRTLVWTRKRIPLRNHIKIAHRVHIPRGSMSWGLRKFSCLSTPPGSRKHTSPGLHSVLLWVSVRWVVPVWVSARTLRG